MRKLNLLKNNNIWRTCTRLAIKDIKSLGRRSGRIVLRRRFSRFKFIYKRIDFAKTLWYSYAYVLNVEYDANRNAFICMLIYTLGILTYIIHCSGLKPGDRIYTSPELRDEIDLGCTTFLQNLSSGQMIHNIEVYPGSGAALSRSAGCFSVILHSKDNSSVWIRLSSKKIVKLSKYCLAVVGVVSNFKFKYKKYKKASSRYNLGRRPSVRGLAMNPVDHPHGGGEGKKSKPRKVKTIW